MPALETLPAIHRTIVSDRREPVSGIVILGLYAPELARVTRPGQFAMALPPGGERAATALAIYEADGERVSLMLVVVGPRTRELAQLHVGAELALLAPLGNGFDLDALGADAAIVAGGVGLASVLLLARSLVARGAKPHLYYGARTARTLVDADKFEALGMNVSLATDDGTRGHRGYVTTLFEREGGNHGAVAACGPSPMLRALGELSARRGFRAQLSLEETFACGVGACWGCVVPHAADSLGTPHGLIPTALPDAVAAGTSPRAVGRLATGFRARGAGDGVTTANDRARFSYVRVCKEGPVFWADSLRW